MRAVLRSSHCLIHGLVCLFWSPCIETSTNPEITFLCEGGPSISSHQRPNVLYPKFLRAEV